MKQRTKNKLMEAWQWCDDEDKSTEFMLSYMADCSGLSYDEVVDYICSGKGGIDRKEWHRVQALAEKKELAKLGYNSNKQ